MNKISLFTINLLLLSGLVSKATNPCDWQGGVNVSKTPSYFPGDGVTVTFDPDAFFTFLWPEKWSAKSSLSFVLVAVNKGQTAEEALLENTPIVQEKYIRSYYIQYPCDAPPLEFGEYAWQIKNADGKTLLTTHFAIGEENSSGYEIYALQNAWMYTKEQLDGSYHIAYDRVLRIHYTEPYEVSADQKLRFCIYDSHRNIVLRTNDEGYIVEPAGYSMTSPTIQTGENWLSFSVGLCSYYDSFSHDYPDDYYLEVWDSKGEKSFLRFRCVHSMPRLIQLTSENN